MTHLPPSIGRYQVLDRLGEGGMGALYLARDPAIDRLVAIKLLRHGFDTEEMRNRFALEARAAGRLHHPHVVTIFDVGEHEGNPFIAMEFLAGETLAQLIAQRARLTLSRKLKLLEELADGLAYAHRHGLVHRDVKPANIMVDAQGVLKILDFGIVRIEESGLTDAGAIVGTVNYMAPEQLTGAAIDQRADIYAAGVVAYELLAYRQAFPGTIKDGLLHRIQNGVLTPLASACPNLHPDVVAIVERAMATQVADRYQDLARMRNDLNRVRQRIENDEAQAETSLSEETAVYTVPLTPAHRTGTVIQKSGTDGQQSAVQLEEAERALSTGKFQLALALAGRSAAVNPENPAATDIVERARLALLEQGRAQSTQAKPAETPVPGPVAAPRTPAPASGTGSQVTPSRRWLTPALAAAAGALVVLLAVVLGVMWPRASNSDSSERSADREVSPAPAPPAVRTNPPSPATPSDERTETPTESSGRPAERVGDDLADAGEGAAGANATSGRADLTSNDDRAGAMRRQAQRELSRRQPERALRAIESGLARTPGDSELEQMLEMLLDEAARRAAAAHADADAAAVARTSREYRAAIAYERSAERARAAGTRARAIRDYWSASDAFRRAANEHRLAQADRAGSGEPSVRTAPPISAPSGPSSAQTLPSAPASNPPAPEPALPPPAPPPPQVQPSGAPAATTPSADRATAPSPAAAEPPPAPDPKAEEAAVRETIRAYRAAWEALDLEALRRVQVLSSDEAQRVAQTMEAARGYRMDIDVQSVLVDPGGSSARAVCQIRREFQPRIGRASRQTVTSTLRLEKRGGRWVIVDVG